MGRRAFQIARWAVTAVAVTILFLILRPGEPPAVRRDTDAPRRLEAKLQRAHEVTSTGGEQALRLDEPELNAWMQSALDVAPVPDPGPPPSPGRAPRHASGAQDDPRIPALDGVTETDLSVEEVQSQVQDVRVRLISDLVVAYVLFDLYGKDLSLELQGRLSVRDGYLRLDPTALWIGSLPIPESTVERAVDRLFGDPAHRESFRVPHGVRDIRVEDSNLVVVYE